MTLSPLVTVVTPSYNALSVIRRCCESIASQDYVPVEHLVMDGGSTDGTVEVLRECRVRYESAPDAGIYDALSKGVRIARGEFVHILCADDRYTHRSVLSSVIAAMTAHEWDVCHARAAHVTASDRVVNVIGRNLDKRRLLKKMWVAQPTVVVRKAVYEQYGAFSVGFRMAADYEFLLRIWDKVRVGFLDEILVNMAIGGISTRPEHVARSYRESMAAAVLHGAHPARATIRCSYEIAKHRLFFARRYRQT
jgi:glycosyltransferase involved in cell wall biosynthesis